VSRPLFPGRSYAAVAVAWLTACGITFAAVFSIDSVDDVVGYVMIVGLFQVPGMWALAKAPDGEKLSTNRVAAVGLPGALVTAASMFLFAGTLANLIWSAPLDYRPAYIAMAAAPLSLVVAVLLYIKWLGGPHPAAARRTLAVFGLVNLVGVISFAMATPHTEPEVMVFLGAVAVWPVPLWLACARRSDSGPRARVIRTPD